MWIDIRSVPQEDQRYATLGDYFDDIEGGKPVKRIRVTQMKDERYEFLIAIHELVEEALTRYHGVAEADILAFDLQFEAERRQGKHILDAEPGNDPRAPYDYEHRFAENIERILALALGVDWHAYETYCASLPT